MLRGSGWNHPSGMASTKMEINKPGFTPVTLPKPCGRLHWISHSPVMVCSAFMLDVFFKMILSRFSISWIASYCIVASY